MSETRNPEHFVGRQEPAARLQAVLRGEIRADGKLTVQSIEGPGGIGKTSLFQHVLASTDLSGRAYLQLKLDGNDPSASSVVRAVVRMSDSADAQPIRGRPPGYYFPSLRRVLKVMDTIRGEATAELMERYGNEEETKAAILRFLDLSFDAGKRINDLAPITRQYLNVEALEKHRPALERILPTLKSLREETPWFFEQMGFGSTAMRNAVKENVCRPLADALVSDLEAVLYRYRSSDVFKATHGKVQGIDRLLLIVDDYEKVQETLGDFLVGYLLPALRQASFESVVILLGRDSLEATHSAWDQHLKTALVKRIVLAPLSRPEMDQLVQSYGVTSQEEKERAWRDTQGYPLYVQLWAEEMDSGGRSAVLLRRFYDRTTRWMDPQEKVWLHHTLFLESVNKRTLRGMLGNPQAGDAAFRWFEREGSVRDTIGEHFRVREYLRSRLLDYLRISDPDLYDELHDRARRIQEKQESPHG